MSFLLILWVLRLNKAGSGRNVDIRRWAFSQIFFVFLNVMEKSLPRLAHLRKLTVGWLE